MQWFTEVMVESGATGRCHGRRKKQCMVVGLPMACLWLIWELATRSSRAFETQALARLAQSRLVPTGGRICLYPCAPSHSLKRAAWS